MQIRELTADNPSPLTGPGTNTFLLGDGPEVAVVDPGPDLPAHRAAILRAAGAARVSAILVTHAHLDHCGGARALAAETGAPVLAMPLPPGTGGGGEGVDAGFRPDRALSDGEVVAVAGGTVTALHLPGHMPDHLGFRVGDTLLSGDLVLAFATTLISPPEGDLVDYLRSLDRVAGLGLARLRPAHGPAIEAPAARLAEVAAHRRARTAQIVAALREAPASAETLAARLYDVPPALLPAASRSVLAHLLALAALGACRAEGTSPADAFTLA